MEVVLGEFRTASLLLSFIFITTIIFRIRKLSLALFTRATVDNIARVDLERDHFVD